MYVIDPTADDPFEPVDDAARAYKRTPTAEKLIGFGTMYDTCGEAMTHFCGDCGRIARDADGEPAEIGQTCWRKQCPRCASGWAMRASYTATAKLESLRKQVLYERPGNNSPRFHHIVISFPSLATAGKDPDEASWEVAKTVLDEISLGYHGALLIHHSHSGNQGDDRGIWKERVFQGRDWEGDVEDELKVRHHVHAIVLADRVQKDLCTTVADRTNNEIIPHRVEQQGGSSDVSLYNEYDLASATTYGFSHARDAEDADTYRYCGRLANHSADSQTEAQMRQVVRSVAPRTLNLDLGDTTCGHATEDEDAKAARPQFDGSGDGSDGESNTTTADGTPKCGGRLVPIEHAPSFIEDVDHRDELVAEYTRWNGAPPPD